MKHGVNRQKQVLFGLHGPRLQLRRWPICFRSTSHANLEELVTMDEAVYFVSDLHGICTDGPILSPNASVTTVAFASY